MNETINYEELGARIRVARQARKLSQQDLAKAADLSMPRVSKIECGKVQMSLASFFSIVNAMELSADFLLNIPFMQPAATQFGDFVRELSDCSKAECTALLQVVKEVKLALRRHSK